MKAKEQMIGDKVMVKVLSQIPDTYVLHTWTANDYSRDIQVKPITLTPEILEKNGFKKIDFSHYQINDRTLVLDADGKWDGEVSWHWVVTEMSTNSKGQNVVLDYYVATLNYVHELQRALRCCGLWDIADNFKV